MGRVIDLPEIELTEPIPVPLIYAESIGRAVIIGDRIHLVEYDDVIGADGLIEHQVVARTAFKIDVMMLIFQAIIADLTQRADGDAPARQDRVFM